MFVVIRCNDFCTISNIYLYIYIYIYIVVISYDIWLLYIIIFHTNISRIRVGGMRGSVCKQEGWGSLARIVTWVSESARQHTDFVATFSETRLNTVIRSNSTYDLDPSDRAFESPFRPCTNRTAYCSTVIRNSTYERPRVIESIELSRLRPCTNFTNRPEGRMFVGTDRCVVHGGGGWWLVGVGVGVGWVAPTPVEARRKGIMPG